MMEEDNTFKQLVSWHFDHPERDVRFSACPGEETLCDYLEDRLEDRVREDLERHLCQCGPCTETLLLCQALAEDSHLPTPADVPEAHRQRVLSCLAPEPRQPLRDIMDRLRAAWDTAVFGISELFASKGPRLVYVRGTRKVISENLVVVEKVFKDVSLQIEVEKTGDRTSDIKVQASAPDSGIPIDGIRINLHSRQREVASLVTVKGVVFFEKITFGDYTLAVWQNKKKIGHVSLTIKE